MQKQDKAIMTRQKQAEIHVQIQDRAIMTNKTKTKQAEIHVQVKKIHIASFVYFLRLDLKEKGEQLSTINLGRAFQWLTTSTKKENL